MTGPVRSASTEPHPQRPAVRAAQGATGQPVGDGPTRRTFLGGIGLGTATVVVAGLGVGGYRVYDNGVLSSGSGTPYDPWSSWHDDPGPRGAVAAGILAANPHNSQPWLFAVAPTRIDLFADPERRTGTLDPLAREHQIGLGCALENVVLAAAARGLRPAVRLMPEPGDPGHVAAVDLGSGEAGGSALYEAIGARHSNRGPYTAEPVDDARLAALAARASGLDGVAVRWFTSSDHKDAFGGLLVEATRAIIADRQQSIDAFAWFRSDRDTIDAHRDGLTLDCQGLAPLMLTVAKLLPASSREAGDGFWLEQTRTVHTRTAAGYGVVTVSDPGDPVQRLTGGRLLQRVHLAATAEGLALQHMNQITERIDREADLHLPAAFAPRLQALLARPGERVLSLFRIGHPVRDPRLSPRRAVSQVMMVSR
jgi:hypothetical protein